MVSTLPSRSLNFKRSQLTPAGPESAASRTSSRTCSALWSDFCELTEQSNAASAFSTNTSDMRSRARTSCSGTCMRVPGRGGTPHVPERVAIDDRFGLGPTECGAQHPEAAGDHRHRGPGCRHRAMATRTTSGRSVATRRPAMGSARSALAFDRAPPRWTAASRAGRPTTARAAHRRSGTVRPGGWPGTRRTERPVHGGAPRRPRAPRGTRTNAGRSGRRPGRHPTATRISNTPGRFSRNDPWPQAPTSQK